MELSTNMRGLLAFAGIGFAFVVIEVLFLLLYLFDAVGEDTLVNLLITVWLITNLLLIFNGITAFLVWRKQGQ